MAFQLYIKNQPYTVRQLKQESPIPHSTAQESAAVGFIQQWLQGAQSFEVKTSGSTGEPKIIEISRERMKASAQLTLQALDIVQGTRAYLCINANYIGGKMMMVRAIEGGLPLWIGEPAADPLFDLPAQIEPHFAALVPLQLQAILSQEKSLGVLNKMKAVMIGGAPVSPALEAQAQQVEAPLYSTYGMTETVSHIALRKINGPHKQAYFQVLPHISIGTDARGCLNISGPVTEGPVQTNDVVELLGADRFRWLGRADNTINSGGVKVQPEQIESLAEQLLAGMGEARRLLAGGLEDERLGQRVALLVEGKPLATSVEDLLLVALQQQLPKYWAPKEILYKTVFIESDNGKIKRTESWQNI